METAILLLLRLNPYYARSFARAYSLACTKPVPHEYLPENWLLKWGEWSVMRNDEGGAILVAIPWPHYVAIL